MANVLGSQSYLLKPDVNGVLVLLENEAVQTLNGTANQITISGTNPTRTVEIASNPIIPGTASITLPIGTTAQRPGSPVAGMTRYNSTINELEYYDSTGWITTGKVIQMVSGTVTSASSNNQIPYDNTTPTSGEGFQLWAQSFTPLRSDSTILIITDGFYTVGSGSDVYVTGAVFSATTCIYAQLLGFTTNSGNGSGFHITATTDAVNTTARTYSFRVGPNINATTYYNQGTGGQAYGSATNSGRYIIQEIAP